MALGALVGALAGGTDAVLGGPTARGGGGVEVGVGATSPPFLLTQRLRSGS